MHIFGLVDGVGIADVFVKETGRKQAERLQILLEQEVIIVGKRGLQIRIAEAAGVSAARLARDG